MKIIYNISITILSLVILIASLVVIFGYKAENYLIQNEKPLLNKATLLSNQSKTSSANYDWSNLQDTNLQELLTTKASNTQDKAIALVTQPEAKVATTIVAGVSSDDLNYSAGTLRPDQKPGEDNYVLAAHHVPKSEWALFSGMFYYGDIGQSIYVTDLNKVYQYKITNTRFVKPSEVDIASKDKYKLKDDGIVPGVPMITTITCDATGDKRFIEFGTLVKTWDIKDKTIPKEAVDGFNKAANFDWQR